MKLVKTCLLFFIILAVTFSCRQQQQARMPISRASGTFMEESAARNIKLIAGEEGQIDSIIKSNPKIKYLTSKKGYWYYYEIKNETDTLRPKKGDIVNFDYEINDITGKVIYSKAALKPQRYAVDKQNLMMGLRDGIKLMHKNETVIFLFPSHMAFGYHGDNDVIKINQPLICKVTLTDIKPEIKAKTSIKTEQKIILKPE